MFSGTYLTAYTRTRLLELFRLFPACWLGVLAVVILTQAGRTVELVFRSGIEFGPALAALTWALFPASQYALAPAWLLALTLVRLRTRLDGETLALSAMGATARRIEKPYLLASLAMTPLAFLWVGWLAPMGLEQTQRWLEKAWKNAAVEGFETGVFVRLGPQHRLFLKEPEADGSRGGVFVEESADGLRVMAAREARLSASRRKRRLDLDEGWFYQRDLLLHDFKHLSVELPTARKEDALFDDVLRHTGFDRLKGGGLPAATEPFRRVLAVFWFPLFWLISRAAACLKIPSTAATLAAMAGWLAASYLLARLGHNLALKSLLPVAVGEWLPLVLIPVALLWTRKRA